MCDVFSDYPFGVSVVSVLFLFRFVWFVIPLVEDRSTGLRLLVCCGLWNDQRRALVAGRYLCIILVRFAGEVRMIRCFR